MLGLIVKIKEFKMLKNLVVIFAICLVIIGSSVKGLSQTDNEQTSTIGTIEKIDPDNQTITVRSNGDVVTAFKWAAKATAHGIKEGAIWTAYASHIGANVVVHSVKIAGVETIKGIEWFGQGTTKVVEGTIRYVGKNGKKIGLIIANGAEEIYEVSEHALVKTGKAAYHGAKVVAKDTAKGAVATIHFVEKEGKKTIHFIEYL